MFFTESNRQYPCFDKIPSIFFYDNHMSSPDWVTYVHCTSVTNKALHLHQRMHILYKTKMRLPLYSKVGKSCKDFCMELCTIRLWIMDCEKVYKEWRKGTRNKKTGAQDQQNYHHCLWHTTATEQGWWKNHKNVCYWIKYLDRCVCKYFKLWMINTTTCQL